MKIFNPKAILTALFLLVFTFLTHAQGFVEPYPIPTFNDGARAVLKDGKEINGKWFGMTGTFKNLKNIQIKTDEGRVKLLTPDVERLYITLSGLMKFSNLMDASTVTKSRGFIFKKEEVDKIGSIVNMSQNWKSVMEDNTAIIYDVVSETEGKYGMRQLLNPGFDSKYKAYLWGMGSKEFMFINKDGEVILTKKKTYSEDFAKLFGDCPSFMELFNPSEIDQDDIAFHLFLYTDMCKE